MHKKIRITLGSMKPMFGRDFLAEIFFALKNDTISQINYSLLKQTSELSSCSKIIV